MRTIRAVLLLVAALWFSGCETIAVTHDADANVDFASYRSWAWISEEPLIQPQAGAGEMSYVSQIDEQRIRRAVERELTAMGYRQTEFARADMIVLFAVATEEKIELQSSPSAGAYYGGRHGGFGASTNLRSYSYTEGTLRIEFFDRENKQAIWVGWASKRLSRSDEAEQTINKAVAMILEKFPPDPYQPPNLVRQATP